MKNSRIYRTLLTPYAENMASEYSWDVTYPRPQMMRSSYFSLNGEWKFACLNEKRIPNEYPETITVPFPPESLLSGIERRIGKNEWLVYSRSFTLPNDFLCDRLILHFGAVDQEAYVYINGKPIGESFGGYIPFSFDITDHVTDGEAEITVIARDALSQKYPYGKQKEKRGGMWYTPVSGIWQTVWLESLPKDPIRDLTIDQNMSCAKITLDTDAGSARLTLLCDDSTYDFNGNTVTVAPKDPHLWSPEDPYLYDFVIETETDRIESYFALREIGIESINGKARVTLNGKPYFLSGLLDQGYYPDGIFLPATAEGYREDILLAKRLGFNMLRKHIKIEPLVFYSLCDRLGMIVFQDMVNNSSYSFLLDTAVPTVGFKRALPSLRHKKAEYQEQFLLQMRKTAELLYNSPCVLTYTIFNEGWGQFSPDENYMKLRELDKTRLIDATSGWFYGKKSDFDSRHIYFRAPSIKNPDGRPVFLSEFGGFSMRCEGHLFGTANYGYSIYRDRDSFENAICSLFENDTAPLIEEGLCATVYTQLSDVEDETNGIITYDRRHLKLDAEKMMKANRTLFEEFKKATEQ